MGSGSFIRCLGPTSGPDGCSSLVQRIDLPAELAAALKGALLLGVHSDVAMSCGTTGDSKAADRRSGARKNRG